MIPVRPERSQAGDPADAPPCKYTQAEIWQRVQQLGEWFHDMDLAGVRTAPNHFLYGYPATKWRRFQHTIPADLSGKTVLDIGCNAGFYSIEMKRRGAERVVAIDTDERYLAQARFAADVLDVDLEIHQLSVYDIDQLGGQFDYVLFMGVLYHLRHPLLALDRVAEVVRERLIFQTMIRGSRAAGAVKPDYDFWDVEPFEDPSFPCVYFVEHAFAGDSTNWWIPNCAAAEAMLRSAGFTILAHPEDEVWLCCPARQ